MPPNPSRLLEKLGASTPLLGCYDAPDPSPFHPLVEPEAGQRCCLFEFYDNFQSGETLHVTRDNPGCGGASYWLWSETSRPRDEFVRFLVETEGLKASNELMNAWLDHQKPYRPKYPHLLMGPLRDDQYAFLRTVTFVVNPDQLSLLIVGAHYHHDPSEPPPVMAPFGSGCMELLPLFEDLSVPQAMIGATDIAMRHSLPPDRLAFTVTKPMFERLCSLDERSFLYKPFWKNLCRARQ